MQKIITILVAIYLSIGLYGCKYIDTLEEYKEEISPEEQFQVKQIDEMEKPLAQEETKDELSFSISEQTDITLVRDICYIDDEHVYIIGFDREAPSDENGDAQNILARYNTTNQSMEVIDTWHGTTDHILRSKKTADGETILFTGVLMYKVSPQNEILERQVLTEYQQRNPCINLSLGKMVYVHSENMNLYSYDFNTKEEKLLYDCSKLGDPNYFVFNPVLSEDGKHVFFQVCYYEAMSIHHMYILNLETGELSEVDFDKYILGLPENVWINNNPALISYVEGKNKSKIFMFDKKANIKNSKDYEYVIDSIKWQNNKITCLLSENSSNYDYLGILNPETLEIEIINECESYVNQYDISPSGDEIAWTEGDKLFSKKISVSELKSEKIEKGYTYIKPIEQTGILYHEWEKTEDISLVSMMSYLSSALENPGNYLNEEQKRYVIPFDVYYKMAVKYFDVGEDYLKASHEYSKEEHAFVTTLGYGGYSIIDVTDVKTKENYIYITLNLYEDIEKNTLLFTSLLTIEKSDEAFKYISNVHPKK